MAVMATTRTSLAAVLLVALAALVLYPESIRQQLLRLPLDFARNLVQRDATATTTGSGTAIDAAGSSFDATTNELDYDALREYVDTNSRTALRWGTYRSGLYYGVRSRSHPFFVAAGLLWGSQHEDISQLRHECRQEDRLQKYGWLQHDGRHYGLQSVEDQFNRVQLHSHYVRLDPHGNNDNDNEADEDDQRSRAGVDGWVSRIEVSHLEPRDERLRKKRVASTKLSLFFYLDLGCEDERLSHECRQVLKNLVDVPRDPAARACESDDGSAATCTQMTLESEGVENSAATASAPLRFRAHVQLKAKASIRHSELRFAGLRDTNVLNVKERLQALAERAPGADDAEIVLDNIVEVDSTLVVVQAIIDADTAAFAPGDVTFDVLFNEDVDSSAAAALRTCALDALVTREIGARSRAFDARFAAAFGLADKNVGSSESERRAFNASDVAFAQAAFSNLMGGIGYFYGSSIVQHDPEDAAVLEAAPKPLFTAVPSRSFFPRGFLWDEGFHQLGIMAFDEHIARDVIVHWLRLMESDGYIAREQILGQAARRRVPAEFLVQHVEHANPPSLLLCIEKMLQRASASQSAAAAKPSARDVELRAFVRLVFPFLERWYNWLLRTQRGPVTTAEMATFRWRGRRADDGKLIANTLSSGLDDYPRASQPSDREMHVDLLAWMIKVSDVMAKLSSLLGLDAARTRAFERDSQRFLTALDAVHWNDKLQSYFDVGDHSDDGRIEHRVVVRCRNDATGAIADTTATQQQMRSRAVACPASHPTYLFPLGDGSGGLKMQQIFIPGTTKLQHVKHIGYVSIFPLLLKVLPADSPKLPALLAQIADPRHLWSPFGLRSMSTLDAFYERENAPGDNPYWRGAIWLNANYLALDALHHYAQPSTQSPFREDFAHVYAQLRANVIATVSGEYARTGYLWEQYNGDVHGGGNYGRGQRCHPFSGWTALVVNIMAEKY